MEFLDDLDCEFIFVISKSFKMYLIQCTQRYFSAIPIYLQSAISNSLKSAIVEI